MRILIPFFLLCGAALCADGQFNGRWDIKVANEGRSRVWWLEVNGAGTPKLSGRFVGAPGGDMNDIPEMAIKNGELRFVFERGYSGVKGDKSAKQRGVYTAKLVGDKLVGQFSVEGKEGGKLTWTGVRAPVIKDKDDGSWKDGKLVKLFNGKDLTGWAPMIAGKELGWKVENGILKNVAGANNLVSAQKFWNYKLHVEFRLGEHTNGGIGLRGRYEVQILEDFGKPAGTHSSGALYSRIAPSENASKPAGEWQTYDIRLVGRTVTIVVNGKTVINKGEIEGLTAIASDCDEALPGPLSVQGDHGPVEIRDLTLTPLVK
jgi:hypothetical protein